MQLQKDLKTFFFFFSLQSNCYAMEVSDYKAAMDRDILRASLRHLASLLYREPD